MAGSGGTTDAAFFYLCICIDDSHFFYRGLGRNLRGIFFIKCFSLGYLFTINYRGNGKETPAIFQLFVVGFIFQYFSVFICPPV